MTEASKPTPAKPTGMKTNIRHEVAKQLQKLFNDHIAPQLSAMERQIVALRKTVRKQEGEIVATQADLDALTASINDDVTKINAEIAALQAANPALDLTALQAAVAGLDATANPAPPATP